MSGRRIVLFGGGAVVIFIAAVIGGWWFLVRETAELATEPREIPQELVERTDGISSSDTLTFQIIPEESEAAYFVDEELARLGLPSTAKGTTNAIEGQLVLTADGTALAPGAESMFTIGLTTLTSDQARRDRSVQQALETSVFPVATFTIEEATGFDPSIGDGVQQDILLTGTLDLHGVQRAVTWEVAAVRESNVISALATVTFSFADFDITPPNIAGIVSVADEATLQVQLIAQLI